MPNDNSLAVADSSHHIVLAGRGYDVGEVVSDAEYDSGIAIVVNDQEVGRLLINDASRSDQPFDRFMGRFYRALGIGSLGATLVALLLGAALARSLTSPLRKLTAPPRPCLAAISSNRYRSAPKTRWVNSPSPSIRMSSDLVEAQNLRRQMTADIAHELRSPLSLILGYAEGLADGVLAADPETIGIIYDEAQQLSRLVDDLRTLSLLMPARAFGAPYSGIALRITRIRAGGPSRHGRSP
jgi:signal transduction histidine kinase